MLKTLLAKNALRWANRKRRRSGDPTVDELLTGVPKRPGECPLANTIGHCARVDVPGWRYQGEERWHRIPFLVRLFVANFDMSNYPELIAPTPAERRSLEQAPTHDRELVNA